MIVKNFLLTILMISIFLLQTSLLHCDPLVNAAYFMNEARKHPDLAQKFQDAGNALDQCHKNVEHGTESSKNCAEQFFKEHYPKTFGIANNSLEKEYDPQEIIEKMVYSPENLIQIQARLAHLTSNALAAAEPLFSAQNNPDSSKDDSIKAAFAASRTFFSSENEKKISPIIDQLIFDHQMSYPEWLIFDRYEIVRACFFSKPIDLDIIRSKLKIYREELQENNSIKSFAEKLSQDTEIISALETLSSNSSDDIRKLFKLMPVMLPNSHEFTEQLLFMANDLDLAFSSAQKHFEENKVKRTPQSCKEEAKINKENLFVLGRALSNSEVETHIMNMLSKLNSLNECIQKKKKKKILNMSHNCF